MAGRTAVAGAGAVTRRRTRRSGVLLVLAGTLLVGQAAPGTAASHTRGGLLAQSDAPVPGLFNPGGGPTEGLLNLDDDGAVADLFDNGGLLGIEEETDTAESAETQTADQPAIQVSGSGWGHSVGMSQYGARTQAMEGRSYRQVLTHYYTGVDVGTAGGLPPNTEIRVHLFRNRDVDATRLELAGASRHGGPASTDVRLHLGPGADAETVVLGHDESATVTMATEGPTSIREDPAFQVTLPGGEQREVDADSLRVSIQSPAGDNPALLRLPQQSVPAGQRNTTQERLTGTYQWGQVRIRHAGDGKLAPVLALPMELYLRGVAEMPNSWEMEALKAQVLAARTFATRPVAKAPDAVWHVDTTPATQAYAGWVHEGGASGDRWVRAIAATQRNGVGEVVTHTASPRDYARTYYSSSHGGRSEDAEDSWAYSQSFPYLQSVDDPWSVAERSGNPYAHWEKAVANDTFAQALGEQIDAVAGVSVLSRTEGTSPKTIEVRGFDDGEPVTVTFSGGEDNTNAGAHLRNPLGLRSQQIDTFGLAPFTDDDGHPLEYNIWAIADEGITAGCDPGDEARYCPQQPVTRGQMATFLARAKDLAGGGDPSFPDVDRDHPHAEGIAAVADAGIAEGFTDGSYRPGRNVTRAQMATFLSRAFELSGGSGATDFGDVEGSPHADAIDAVAAAGITEGCAENRYCPGHSVTRAQMAAFLARALGTGW